MAKTSVFKRSLLVVVLLCALVGVHSKVTILTQTWDEDHTGWEYVDKFCFDIGLSHFHASLLGSSRPLVDYKAYLYLDEQWDEVLDPSVSCADKVSMAKSYVALDSLRVNPPCEITQSIRAHFWFVAIANCDHPINRQPFTAEVNLTWLDNKDNHIGYDEKGLPSIYSAVFCLTTAACLVYAYATYQFYQRVRDLPLPVAMLTVALALFWLTLCLQTAHLSTLARDGLGRPLANTLAGVTDTLTHVVFLALFLSIAEGWTLLSRTLPHRNQLGLAFAAIATLQVVLALTAKMYDGMHSVYHSNETFPGLMIVLLRLVLFAHFARSALKTHAILQEEPRKGEFFFKFCVGASAWMLALPLLVLVASLFAAYLRHKLVSVGVLLAQCVALVLVSWQFLTQSEFFKISTFSHAVLDGLLGVGRYA